MTNFKCRAECSHDIELMKLALVGSPVSFLDVSGVEVLMESQMALHELRERMMQVGNDTHRMFETLNTADQYNGEVVYWTEW